MDTSNPVTVSTKDPQWKHYLLLLAGLLGVIATLPQHFGFVLQFLPQKYAAWITTAAAAATAIVAFFSQYFPDVFPKPPSNPNP